MIPVLLRLVKGSELTFAEADQNFLMLARYASEWGPDVQYTPGQMTCYSGVLYKALTTSTNKQPDINALDWAVYVPAHQHVFADLVAATVNEDDMASNSASLLPTQRSVKAYVDANVGTVTYTDEKAQDAVAAAMTAPTNTTIQVTYNDATNQIALEVKSGSIGPTYLAATGAANGYVLSYSTAGGGTFVWDQAPNPFNLIKENSSGSFTTPTVGANGSVVVGSASVIGTAATHSFVMACTGTVADGSGGALYCGLFGGYQNTVTGSTSSGVFCGDSNSVGQSAVDTVVLGGRNHLISTGIDAAAILAGNNCTINGNKSVVLAGDNSSTGASAVNSVAVGKYAATSLPGQVALAAGGFASTAGASQTNIIPSISAITTDATTTTLLIDQTAQLSLPSDTTWQIMIRVTARQTGGSAGTVGDCATFRIDGAVNNIGGTASLVGTPDTGSYSVAAAATWTVALAVSGSNLQIRVTGEANKTIRWNATVLATVAS